MGAFQGEPFVGTVCKRVVAAGGFGEDSGADGLDADYLQFVSFELRVVSL